MRGHSVPSPEGYYPHVKECPSGLAASCSATYGPGTRLLVLLQESERLLPLCQGVFGSLAEDCSLK